VREKFPESFRGTRVLEIGSYNVNGTPRAFFEQCEYTGLDLLPGPGVDVVGVAHEYDLPDASVDVVLSCECFEHNPYWAETLGWMVRVLRPGGLCVITCATTGRPVHGTWSTDADGRAAHEQWVTLPNAQCERPGWDRDYYRNLTEADFRSVLSIGGAFTEYVFEIDTNHCDLFFWGRKRVR